MSTPSLFDREFVTPQKERARSYYAANRETILAKSAERRKRARKAQNDRASYLRRKERKLKEQEVLESKFTLLGFLRNLFTGGAR